VLLRQPCPKPPTRLSWFSFRSGVPSQRRGYGGSPDCTRGTYWTGKDTDGGIELKLYFRTTHYGEGYRLFRTKAGLVCIRQLKASNQTLSGSHAIRGLEFGLDNLQPRPSRIRFLLRIWRHGGGPINYNPASGITLRPNLSSACSTGGASLGGLPRHKTRWLPRVPRPVQPPAECDQNLLLRRDGIQRCNGWLGLVQAGIDNGSNGLDDGHWRCVGAQRSQLLRVIVFLGT